VENNFSAINLSELSLAIYCGQSFFKYLTSDGGGGGKNMDEIDKELFASSSFFSLARSLQDAIL
jgi:hypothetical protein